MGSGLAVLGQGHKRFTVYNRYNSKLASNVVFSIFSDSHNNLWVGTGGGGLNLLNKKTNQFISFTEKDGLANDVVYKVIEDEKGLLWLSTNKGICSFNPKTRKFNNYTFHNGVQNSNFALGSGLRLSDGEMFFGGLDGFNYFKPSDLKKNKNVPLFLLLI